jgi:hypothetical protein
MTRFRTRTLAALLAVSLVPAACSNGSEPGATASVSAPVTTASASASAPPSVGPSEASSPSETARPSADPSRSASAEAMASPGVGFPTAFEVMANAEADALFATRDACRNPRDNYELEYPDDWYTNTEIRDVPACSWFAATFYDVDDFDDIPDEIGIEIFWIPGDRGYTAEIQSSENGIVGGQYATRVEVAGTSDDPAEGTSYEYVIQLGPSPEEGPNLVARTDSAMGGDPELNRAVLDRMMATIEFTGSTQ